MKVYLIAVAIFVAAIAVLGAATTFVMPTEPQNKPQGPAPQAAGHGGGSSGSPNTVNAMPALTPSQSSNQPNITLPSAAGSANSPMNLQSPNGSGGSAIMIPPAPGGSLDNSLAPGASLNPGLAPPQLQPVAPNPSPPPAMPDPQATTPSSGVTKH